MDNNSTTPVPTPTPTLLRGESHGEEHAKESSVVVNVLENLAWGRSYGGCYPHHRCTCHAHRSFSEMISISTDPVTFGGSDLQFSSVKTLEILLSNEVASKLIQFHINHLAWHHNIIHSPTFLVQCEVYFQTGKCPHPLWMALYLSILSSTIFSVYNSTTYRSTLDLDVDDQASRRLFEAMIDVLYSEDFMKNVSLYTIQAIVLSTEVAHNLGLSGLNATLSSAAIRLAQCMGLHKIEDLPARKVSPKEDWHELLELINPKHFLTALPLNCDDHDLEARDDEIPTVSSYVRTLARLASLMPELLDGLGPLKDRKPLQEQYRHVLESDRQMRQLVGQIPSFLLRAKPDEQAWKPWLGLARQSLAITAADKIIMIHRPFLIASFQTSNYPYTRTTCVSAAVTILRRHHEITIYDDVSIWTHSAFCVTAILVLCLELLYRGSADMAAEPDDADKLHMYHDLVNQARGSLSKRQGDIMATRGVRLIDTMLSAEQESMWQTNGNNETSTHPSSGVNFRKLVAQFLAQDRQAEINFGTDFGLPSGGLDMAEFYGPMDIDFDIWFKNVFGSGSPEGQWGG
ncbi:hypothetical protein BP5796_06552 [Coleophoma crateriformis]|uniref:Xylanolytic transcriptional activator regulatory domain-containing protein n=1 Tax=Coleophoma crateriformis TaxID=565419 RepID=A0A3D8RPK1_9HELO|nr:hypothetical protein BP5796_06552 [Coleophoma crateriformis]